jgi:hypothetical protein
MCWRSGVTLSAFVTRTRMRACNKRAERQPRVPGRWPEFLCGSPGRSRCEPLLSGHLPDLRQVMVIVLRDKVQMIHKSHGLLQTRVQFGLCKEFRLKLA